MTITQAPLEKQLVNIDLSKGMDERRRPELSSAITTIHNLVQDQTGAWVKRDGLTRLGGAILPSKLLRMREGLAAISTTGHLQHYQEGLGAWLDKGSIPSFSVEKADLVASSGPNAFGYVYANASCTKYHAVVTMGGSSSVGGIALLTIYDRSSGATVGTYDLTAVCNNGDLLTYKSVKMVFVADRYLSVFMSPNASVATKLFGFVIDTNNALPANSAAITPTVLHTATGLGATIRCPQDVAAYTDRSFCAFSDSVGTYILSMNTAGAFVEEVTITSVGFIACTLSGNLWYTSAAQIGARSATALTSQTVALGNTGAGATVAGFGVDAAGTSWLLVQTNKTVGASAVVSNAIWKANTPGGTACTLNSTLDGWRTVSHPFVGDDGKMYIHMCKDFLHSAAVNLAPHIIVNITDKSDVYAPSGTTCNSFRIGCTLEPFVGASTDNGIGTPSSGFGGNTMCRYEAQSGAGVAGACPVVAVQTASRGFGIAVFTIKLLQYGGVTTKVFGGSNYVSGGTHVAYAGDKVQEAGFLDYPIMAVAQSSGAGAIGAGLYKYVSVYRCVDETGAISFSRCSDPFSVTLAASKKGDMTIVPCAITMRDPFGNAVPGSSPISIDVYRTLAGGTQYYLIASSQVGTPATGLSTQLLTCAGTKLWTFSDNLTDAVVAAQPLLHRQPGTVNSPLDRYPPPGGKILCQHKDRLFTADPYGQRIYYSSFFVDGEAAWFAPAFSFFVHGASGPITAIASMDGRLVVFKRDGVFLVDGDGPSEGGPNGSEYSPPQRIATSYGCVDQNSLVLTTEGLVYRSTRGIELLDRNLRVDWVGDAVQETINDYPDTTGTCLDTFGRVHIIVRSEDAASGAELIWDIPAKAWSVNKYTTYDDTYGGDINDAVIADIFGLGEVVCYADPTYGVYYGNSSSFLDVTNSSNYVPTVVETGWIASGPQARQRISAVLLLAKKIVGANHAVRVSLAYDYVDSYTQSYTWEPDVINTLSIEELLLKPTKQQVLALRVKVEDVAPSDTGTYPVGTGAGCAVLGVCCEAAQIQNAPLANRGTVGVLSIAPRVSAVSPATGGAGGGTPVTVYGVDFTASTLITIGGVALTSLVYVSPNVMTGITGAHAAAAADVTAVNLGGTGTLSSGYTYSSSAFDAADLELSAWWRNWTALGSSSGSPASPSAGASQWARDIIDPSGNHPTPGSLNGHGTLVLNGLPQVRSISELSTLWLPATGSILFLYNVVAPDAPIGNIYGDKCILSDGGNANLGVTVSTNGITGFAYSGGGFRSATQVAAAGWHVGMFTWSVANNATTLYLDSLAPVAGTMPGNADITDGTHLRLGFQYGVGYSLVGELAEIATSQLCLSAADFANFRSYCNDRYALSL